MKFDNLDLKMRMFETANDRNVMPEMYMIARIDGRGFTKLTKEKHDLEVPFDLGFRNVMIETVKHLMVCGFNVIYGYTQSDEISLLFHYRETTFSRKIRKYNSILAGEASAKFSLLFGDLGVFDCRISEFPNKHLVVDYFRWRNEDAHRNALNAHCYWNLRKNNFNKTQATRKIEKLTISQKNDLLFQYGINFNDIPCWHKRGVGIYWAEISKKGVNPKTNTETLIKRKTLLVNDKLPMKEEYSLFIYKLLEAYE